MSNKHVEVLRELRYYVGLEKAERLGGERDE